MNNITNSVKIPTQFKMSSGAIYAGFAGPVDQYGMIEVQGACSIVFIRAESRYEVNGLMTSTSPVRLGLSCIQMTQNLVLETDTNIAYCRYLGTILATMEDQEENVPQEFYQYIDHVDPYFKKQFEGLDIKLMGLRDYAVFCDDRAKVKEYQQRMDSIVRAFNEKPLTEKETSCQPNVVHLQFGSKGNAPEKGED